MTYPRTHCKQPRTSTIQGNLSRASLQKFALIAVFFVCSISVNGLTFSSGFINDNYTGSPENGEAGRYWGADDYLTYGMNLSVSQGAWQVDVLYGIVTSRMFDYRYDLIHAELARRFAYNPRNGLWNPPSRENRGSAHPYSGEIELMLEPRLGILLTGNFGGDFIQNTFHDLKSIPRVDLPYEIPVAAILGGVNLAANFTPGLLPDDRFSILIDSVLTTGVKPVRALALGEYWLLGSIGDVLGGRLAFSLGLAGGYQLVASYEAGDPRSFLRSGWLAGFIASASWQAIFVQAGLIVFPAANLENDPTYREVNHDYNPRFTVQAGIGIPRQSLAALFRFL